MSNECKSRYTRANGHSVRDRDYLYARLRARLAHGSASITQRVYDALRPEGRLPATKQKRAQLLERSFREQVNRWKDETGHLSSITKAIAHPSYLRIIGLAKNSSDHQIEKLLLNELEAEPDHWFAALSAITGEDPVKPEDDFDDAVAAWLEWGRKKEII